MSNLFSRLRFFLFIFFVSVFITACGNTIRGTFTRDDTPAPDRTVLLRDSQSGKEQQTQTDANGQFVFHNVAKGSYELVVKFKFETQTQDCELTQDTYVTGDDVTQDIELPDSIDLTFFSIFHFGAYINCE